MSDALRKFPDDGGSWYCLEPLVPAMGPNDEMHRRALRWFRVRDGNVEITNNWNNRPNIQGSRLLMEIEQFRQMSRRVGPNSKLWLSGRRLILLALLITILQFIAFGLIYTGVV